MDAFRRHPDVEERAKKRTRPIRDSVAVLWAWLVALSVSTSMSCAQVRARYVNNAAVAPSTPGREDTAVAGLEAGRIIRNEGTVVLRVTRYKTEQWWKSDARKFVRATIELPVGALLLDQVADVHSSGGRVLCAAGSDTWTGRGAGVYATRGEAQIRPRVWHSGKLVADVAISCLGSRARGDDGQTYPIVLEGRFSFSETELAGVAEW